MLISWKTQYTSDVASPQIDIFEQPQSKPPQIVFFYLFVDSDKLILKFMWKYKGPRAGKITLKKKDKVREHTLPDFETYKVIIIRIV